MPACLGLDYGTRKIGIAVSNDDGTIAFAVGTHVEGRDGSIMTRLSELIETRDVATIVLGLPLTVTGQETDMAERARTFGQKLGKIFEIPIHYMDERYTSQEARKFLRTRKRPHKEDVDALAAEIILQAFLEKTSAAQQDSSGPASGDDDS